MTDPHQLTVRSSEDLLACVPIMLGFLPEGSVVMLGMPPDRAFHARVDIPPAEQLPQMCAGLVGPALRHRMRRVVLCVFTALDQAPPVVAALVDAFVAAGIEVSEVLAADGRRWRAMLADRSGQHGTYDALSHPFVVEAVVAGHVVLGSRAQLAARLDPDPRAVGRVVAALNVQAVPDPSWVVRTAAAHAAAGTCPTTRETARLVVAMGDPDCRDAAWGTVRRDEARSHVDVWLAVARATPDPLVAAPAAVVAFLAWLAGDGALAWCALDRSRAARVPCSLAGLVEDLLSGAVSPLDWEPVLPQLLGADPGTGGAA
jgi:Domain of unknown function (DUF4192)